MRQLGLSRMTSANPTLTHGAGRGGADAWGILLIRQRHQDLRTYSGDPVKIPTGGVRLDQHLAIENIFEGGIDPPAGQVNSSASRRRR